MAARWRVVAVVTTAAAAAAVISSRVAPRASTCCLRSIFLRRRTLRWTQPRSQCLSDVRGSISAPSATLCERSRWCRRRCTRRGAAAAPGCARRRQRPRSGFASSLRSFVRLRWRTYRSATHLDGWLRCAVCSPPKAPSSSPASAPPPSSAARSPPMSTHESFLSSSRRCGPAVSSQLSSARLSAGRRIPSPFVTSSTAQRQPPPPPPPQRRRLQRTGRFR